jgi:hypothetical protein
MMKKFFKIVFIALGVVLASAALLFHSWLIEPLSAQDTPISDVREGDVIFQTTQSSQSPLIQIGTRSRITHCGIIVMRDGEPYVLETLRTLVLTPLNEFIARGVDGKYWLKRSDKQNIQIEYSHYLGKTYDLAFSFDNDIYYCSELVYDIYKKQLGIELCKPKRVGDYLILCTDRLPQIESVMKHRGITKEQYAVAPVDIFESEYLRDVG